MTSQRYFEFLNWFLEVIGDFGLITNRTNFEGHLKGEYLSFEKSTTALQVEVYALWKGKYGWNFGSDSDFGLISNQALPKGVFGIWEVGYGLWNGWSIRPGKRKNPSIHPLKSFRYPFFLTFTVFHLRDKRSFYKKKKPFAERETTITLKNWGNNFLKQFLFPEKSSRLTSKIPPSAMMMWQNNRHKGRSVTISFILDIVGWFRD